MAEQDSPLDERVLGMPIEIASDLAQPIAAVVIVKGLDTSGEIAYWTAKTDGVTGVEAWGMVMFAEQVARTAEVTDA
jgi:hypothetical protein